MLRETMVTTTDNPFDPFTQFDQWQAFDHYRGYYTLEYLCRVACTADEFSEEMNALMIEHAVDEIVSFDLIGENDVHYKKVVRDSDKASA